MRKVRGIAVGPLRVIRDQCLSARANFDADMLHTRWTLLKMRKDALQRGLRLPTRLVPDITVFINSPSEGPFLAIGQRGRNGLPRRCR